MEYKVKKPTIKDAKDILNNHYKYVSNGDFLIAVIYMLDNELINKENLLREKSSIIEKQNKEILNLKRTIDKLIVSRLSYEEKEDFINRIIDAINGD